MPIPLVCCTSAGMRVLWVCRLFPVSVRAGVKAWQKDVISWARNGANIRHCGGTRGGHGALQKPSRQRGHITSRKCSFAMSSCQAALPAVTARTSRCVGGRMGLAAHANRFDMAFWDVRPHRREEAANLRGRAALAGAPTTKTGPNRTSGN